MIAGRVALLRGRILILPLAALAAVLPVVVHGCSCGHDFDFHLLSWMEAARQFSHGNLHPHWAFSPAFNAGEPRFVFYPPLSWMLGALLGLLLTHMPGVSPSAGWSAAPVAFTWLALTACGFTMYRLARSFAGANAALLAAILYLANPYMLFTAYERTAFGELLAAAWIPLLLHAVLRNPVSIPRVALPVALLWLTNIPAAIIGSYALALLAAVRLVSENRPDARGAMALAWKAFSGFAVGLGLASFYLVPAVYESRFVQMSMATIADMRIDHNFLFEHTGTSADALLHDQVLHTASVIAVILLAAGAVLLAWAAIQRNGRGDSPALPILPLALLAAGIVFLLTPLSSAIWEYAPAAALLQFPWRLLALAAAIAALAGAAALDRLPLKFKTTGAAATALAALLIAPAYHAFRQPCDPADTVPARFALFQSNAGSDPTDEYTPMNADNDALKPNTPPYWLADSPEAPAPSAAPPGPAPMHLTLTAPRAEVLVLNLRAYPAWRILLNGTPAAHPAERDDGLIAFPIPAGRSAIDIGYAQTSDQALGYCITLFALALFLVATRSRSAAERSR